MRKDSGKRSHSGRGTTTPGGKRRNTKRNTPKRTRKQVLLRWALRLSIIGFVLGILGIISLATLIYLEAKKVPQTVYYEEYLRRIPQMSRMVANDGSDLKLFYKDRRIIVPKENIPQVVQLAFVASEDADFFSHGGLDYWGIFRSAIQNVLRGKYAQGGSTITQQVARSFHLSRKKTLRRKLREMILSRRFEQKLTKDEILSLYLNSIYFGHGRYGIEAASRFFFGKSALYGCDWKEVRGENSGDTQEQCRWIPNPNHKEGGDWSCAPCSLTVREAALLAGLVQSPNRLSPYRYPDRAMARRNYVIKQMVAKGFLDSERGERAIQSPLGVLSKPPQTTEVGRYFVDAAERRLKATLGYIILERGVSIGAFERMDPKLRSRLIRRVGRADLRAGLTRQQITALPDELRRKVTRSLASDALSKGGLWIQTTMDTRAQKAADAAVSRGLARFDATSKQPLWRITKHFDNLDAGRAELKKRKRGKKPVSGRTVPGLITAVDGLDSWLIETPWGPGVLRPGFAKVRLAAAQSFVANTDFKKKKAPTVPERLEYKPGDYLQVMFTGKHVQPATPGAAESEGIPEYQPDMAPHASLVALDSTSREVLALVGGANAEVYPYNRAIQTRRQAGSAFKPLLYATAVEKKVVDENTLFFNTPETYRLPDGRLWSPSNYSGTYDGAALSLADAVAHSVNVVAVQVLSRFSVKDIITVARRLGLDGNMEPNLTLALGSAEVSPLGLTNAIATIPAGGLYQNTGFIRRIVWPDGTKTPGLEIRAWWDHLQCTKTGRKDCPTTDQVFSQRTARTMTRLMAEVVQRGTARSIRKLGQPAAGKTGTTNRGRNLWFVGFTPRFSAGVLFAFDDRRGIKKGTGGRYAAPIWLDFSRQYLEGSDTLSFGPWMSPPPKRAKDLVTAKAPITERLAPVEPIIPPVQPLGDDPSVDNPTADPTPTQTPPPKVDEPIIAPPPDLDLSP
ncbi:MAG: hypothetical protein CMH54_15415 [Myxococcales bacterium]|nr:hypothetical protein [Myxococcales bacterium]